MHCRRRKQHWRAFHFVGGDAGWVCGNRVFPFCSLGGEPQDKKYRGEKTALTVGDNNTIREYCFFNRGTVGGGGATKIGDNNWIMGYTHLAHDCVLGGGAIVANGAQFAGHVEVGDGAVIGGGALFHQFLRIGARAMVGGGEAVRQDIPPFAMSARGAVGVNAEGMRRAGFGARARAQIQKAYRILYLANLPLEESRRQIAEMLDEDSAACNLLSRAAKNFPKRMRMRNPIRNQNQNRRCRSRWMPCKLCRIFCRWKICN